MTHYQGFPTDDIYVPGVRYNVTGGITQKQFEGSIGKAIPAEDGFIQNLNATNKAILVCNLASRALNVVLDGDRELNRQYGNQRWNEREKQGVLLDNGRCTHFPISSRCYIFSVGEYVIGLNGERYFETSLGEKLSAIVNTATTVSDGPQDGEIAIETNGNAQQNGFFSVQNLLDRYIYTRLIVEQQAYPLSESALNAEKESRKVDLGGKIVEETKIPPGATQWFKKPPLEYNVRVLEPFAITQRPGIFLAVPPPTDYVEDNVTRAGPGDTVVIFNDSTQNGAVTVKTYKTASLKLVKSDIVVSNNNRNT